MRFLFCNRDPVLPRVSAIDSDGRTIWIADAHCGDGKRFVVRADDKLTSFLELARPISIHFLIKDVGPS